MLACGLAYILSNWKQLIWLKLSLSIWSNVRMFLNQNNWGFSILLLLTGTIDSREDNSIQCKKNLPDILLLEFWCLAKSKQTKVNITEDKDWTKW